MLSTIERINPRTNKLRGVSAGLLAVVALAGCSSSKTEATVTKPSTTVTTKAKPSPKPSESKNTTTTTTEAGPFNPYNFEAYNKQHNTALYNAAQYYGNIILNQAKNPNSPWGPWKKACKPGSYFTSNLIHKGSEQCITYHPHSLGKNIYYIAVDVSANNKGSDRKGIVSFLSMFNKNCGAEIIFNGPGGGWEADVLEPDPSTDTMTTVGTGVTTTLAQAQALDKQAIACFASIKP